MKLVRAVAISLAIVASACAPAVEMDGAQETTTVPDLRPTTTPTFETVDTAPDPRTEEVLYTCGAAEFSLTELANLDDLPKPNGQEFELMTKWNNLGTLDRWVTTGAGYAIDTTPLQSTPAEFVYTHSVEEWDPSHCVPITKAYSGRPLHWRIESVSDNTAVLAIESCVDPSLAIVDIRVVSNQSLAWIYGERDFTHQCGVDGSTTIEVELPADTAWPLLSGFTWPPLAADPENWFTEITPPPTDVTAAELGAITCEAVSEVHGVSIYWYDVPYGLTGEILADGSPEIEFESKDYWTVAEAEVLFSERMIYYGNPAEDYEVPIEALAPVPNHRGATTLFGQFGPDRQYQVRVSTGDGMTQLTDCGEAGRLTEVPAPECSLTLTGGLPSFEFVDPHHLYTPGVTLFYRDGEPIEFGIQFGGPIDTSAIAGTTYSYTVEFVDTFGNLPTVTSDCGSITAAESSGPDHELSLAKALFERIGKGPYIYMTVRTGEEERPLFMEWTPANVHEFEPLDPEAEAFDPFTVHDRLAAAIEAGGDVTYELNAASGLPISWTIDGVERGFVCLQFDTQVPESRDPNCLTRYNMIR